MLLKAENLTKEIGLKLLFEDMTFVINEGEKIGFIGRNGLGKSTLLKLISGEDEEYQGKIESRKDTEIIVTKQEHFRDSDKKVFAYILESLPRFAELQEIITSYEKDIQSQITLDEYCDAINEFAEKGFYEIRDEVIKVLSDFQVSEEKLDQSVASLSGGEKRFIELTRVIFSEADLALIDEPTNHMDYVGKERFIRWLDDTDQTVLVVTHDRDVLKNVDKIFELKDKKIKIFNGNYDDYIKQNSHSTLESVQTYESDLKKIDKTKKQLMDARLQKLTAKSNKGRIQAKIREERFERQYEKLQEELNKPSFWIDKESLNEFSDKVVDRYNKYKEKNIKVSQKSEKTHKRLILSAKNISIGYKKPLFENVFLQLYSGDRIFIKGRNGAGKSSLIKYILSKFDGPLIKNILEGKVIPKSFAKSTADRKEEIKTAPNLRIGVYEQEINEKFLKLTLSEAVMKVFQDLDIAINQDGVNRILGSYLFDPTIDGKLKIEQLSGGQKARFQLIKMFANEPELLILDEPTNHLDLPSIEELEIALQDYHGGIIYISHDSYFVEKMGGEVIEL